jgi:hypothetical protein
VKRKHIDLTDESKEEQDEAFFFLFNHVFRTPGWTAYIQNEREASEIIAGEHEKVKSDILEKLGYSDEIATLKQHVINLCTIITGAIYAENLDDEQIEQVHEAMDFLPDCFPPREERE